MNAQQIPYANDVVIGAEPAQNHRRELILKTIKNFRYSEAVHKKKVSTDMLKGIMIGVGLDHRKLSAKDIRMCFMAARAMRESETWAAQANACSDMLCGGWIVRTSDNLD